MAKIRTLRSGRVQASFDVYNVFNQSKPLVINNVYGTEWQRPTQIMDGRLGKVAVEVSF